MGVAEVSFILECVCGWNDIFFYSLRMLWMSFFCSLSLVFPEVAPRGEARPAWPESIWIHLACYGWSRWSRLCSLQLRVGLSGQWHPGTFAKRCLGVFRLKFRAFFPSKKYIILKINLTVITWNWRQSAYVRWEGFLTWKYVTVIHVGLCCLPRVWHSKLTLNWDNTSEFMVQISSYLLWLCRKRDESHFSIRISCWVLLTLPPPAFPSSPSLPFLPSVLGTEKESLRQQLWAVLPLQLVLLISPPRWQGCRERENVSPELATSFLLLVPSNSDLLARC